jgi:hypothetical protein
MMSLSEIVSEINLILQNHGIADSITATDITVTERTISDLVHEDARLSATIVESIWPTVTQAELLHYTTRNAAESIATSGKFRMASLMKRFTEGEVIAFCEDHKLDGYLKADSNGDPKYKSMLNDLYYVSFAGTNVSKSQDRQLWKDFGGRDGARLRVRVQAANPDFRRVIYQKPNRDSIPVLHALSRLAANNDRYFILQKISHLCAFYLPTKYWSENEYRILYKGFVNFGLPIKSDGEYAFVEIPLGQKNESGYEIALLEVQTEDGTFHAPTSASVSVRP